MKKNTFILICILMFIVMTSTVSAKVAYSFFDNINLSENFSGVTIGTGLWDSDYIFANLDPENFNTTGVWDVNLDGFISNNGNVYIPNRKAEYTLTSTAILGGDTITHGAYRIYFESTLNANNFIDGYALVWDNIASNVRIISVENGNSTSSLFIFNNSTNSFLPQSTSSVEWRQSHDIVIQVSESVTPGFKHLNVWIDNNQLISDYLINAVTTTNNNITGYYSYPLQTTFIEMNITEYDSNVYTITFDSNGGSLVNSIREASGTLISAPSNPTKMGYTFIEWTLSGSTYTFGVMPSQNITLIANWQANPFTITFNSNGGSAVSPITQGYETAVSAPNSPTKTGYSFSGWYSDAGLTSVYNFTTMPNQNITLYAKWTINQYTITFDSNGGSVVSPITQNYGTTVIEPTSPTKDGYVFNEWTYQASTYTFGVMPASDITLIAVWTEIELNEYIITFNSNGGSAVTSIVETEGNAISAPSSPTKIGYTFTGWYSDIALTNLYIFDIMPSQNITLYAGWTINQYTITFNSNGGSAISPIVQDYNTSVVEPTEPTRSGYIFIEWTYNSNSYSFTTMPASDITLIASWEQILYYTITFNSNGGSAVTSIVEQNGVAISAPTIPTRIGHTFDGWYIDAGLTNVYTFNIMPNYNFTLYAKWTINSYTITFITNGGSTITPITQNYGTTVVSPTDPIKAGNYFFAGWYSDAKLQNEFVFNTMPANNINIYADWGSTGLTFELLYNGYSVTGITSESSNIQIPQRYQGMPVVEIGISAFQNNTFIQSINIPYTLATISDYAFAEVIAMQKIYIPNNVTYIGRGAFQDCTSLTINVEATSKPASWNNKWNISNLLVNWGVEFIPSIVFDSNGGSIVYSITQEGGTSVTAPTAPTKEGYTFVNWYSDEALTTAYIFNIMPAQNTVLYAKWSINQYTITFDSDGGSAVSPITQNYNTNITSPTNPIKTGYMFVEWTYNSNPYTFTTMPSQNITLIASWQEIVINEYIITFDSNGGSAVTSIVETEGNAISAPSSPTKIGYTFTGWYSDIALTNLYIFDIMPSQNITLYAGWTINQYTITFVTNGGSVVAPMTQNYGSSISAPANPVKTGNLFSGWYSDVKLKTQFIFSTMPAMDFTIYADWGTTGLTYQLISGVGYRVVSGDSTLTTIQIPQRYQGMPVVEIGVSAFANYTLLQHINIPYMLTTIGDNAFANCTALQEIYIPINVTTIGANAFKGSRSLTINVQATSKPVGWSSTWSKNVGIVNWGVEDI